MRSAFTHLPVWLDGRCYCDFLVALWETIVGVTPHQRRFLRCFRGKGVWEGYVRGMGGVVVVVMVVVVVEDEHAHRAGRCVRARASARGPRRAALLLRTFSDLRLAALCTDAVLCHPNEFALRQDPCSTEPSNLARLDNYRSTRMDPPARRPARLARDHGWLACMVREAVSF